MCDSTKCNECGENGEHHFAIFTFNSDKTIIEDIETSVDY